VDAGQAHVHDEGLPRLRELGPIEIDRVARAMAGHESHRLRAIAMRERDAGIGSTTERGSDAGHDLARDTVVRERFDLLAAPAEDERIAAFEPHDALSLPRLVREQPIDRALAHLRQS